MKGRQYHADMQRDAAGTVHVNERRSLATLRVVVKELNKCSRAKYQEAISEAVPESDD